jgi:uncharacterized protein
VAFATAGCADRIGEKIAQSSGYVIDEAQILVEAEEAELNKALSSLEHSSRHQLVVVTVPTLGGKSVEAYSLAQANRAGIGRKGHDDGVMVLVAPNERTARIEVGKGLEAALTNAEAQTIMDRDMIPAFRSKAYFAGLKAGTQAIAAEITDSDAAK